MNQSILKAKSFAIVSIILTALALVFWQTAFTHAQTPTADITANGSLDEVNSTAGTITITTQSGMRLVLSVTPQTVITANNCPSNLGFAEANVGGAVTVQYNAQTNVATSLSINGTVITCSQPTPTATAVPPTPTATIVPPPATPTAPTPIPATPTATVPPTTPTVVPPTVVPPTIVPPTGTPPVPGVPSTGGSAPNGGSGLPLALFTLIGALGLPVLGLGIRKFHSAK